MEDSHGLLPAHPAVCRFQLGGDRARLGWWDGKSLVDLSATAGQACSSLGALLAAGTPLGTAVAQAANTAPRVALDAASLLSPIDAQEVWAAGVTYERSRAARMTESEYAADAYWRVYDAERP